MNPLGSLRALGRATGFAAWTAGAVYGHRVMTFVDSDFATPWGKQRVIHLWSRGVFPLFGVELRRVSGSVPTDLGPFLVVCNHRSPLDILIAIHLMGGVVLSHQGVEKMPVIGHAARYTDTIFVDRADDRSGARAIREMRRRLIEGRNVIVFPEGTTFPGDSVRPFKRGAFAAARRLKVKALPLGVAYLPGDEYFQESFTRHLGRVAARPRTPIWVSIGQPVTAPRTSREEAELRDRVQALVDQAATARDAEGRGP